MKVVQKGKGENTLRFEVTASTAEVSRALSDAAVDFCRANGVHPSKDKSLAESARDQLGIRDLDAVVAAQAAEYLVPFALDKRNIVPAFMPSPEARTPLRRGKTFQFELTVMPKPSYELDSYDPVSVTVEAYKPDEAEVERQLSQMAEGFAAYERAEDKTLESGDNVKIAITCTQDGEEVKGLTTDGRTYTVDQGLMPEGFDRGIMGMEVGETRTFTFEGPDVDEAGEEVARRYEATVTYLENQKQVVPVIDDAWVARNMPMYRGLAGLKGAIGERVNAERKRQYDEYVRSVAVQELARRFKGSIPDEVYEGQARTQVQSLRQQIAQNDMTWEQFLEQNGGEQQVQMMLMMQTRALLVNGFSLDALYREKKLSFTDADIDAVCKAMNPQNPVFVRTMMEQRGQGFALRESAERFCANNYLVEHADITVRDATAAPAADAAPEGDEDAASQEAGADGHKDAAAQ